MTSSKPEPEAIVCVEPRLLNDALCVVLREEGLSVSVCPTVDRRARPRQPRRFAVAVVSESLPVDVEAEKVIVIDENATPAEQAGAKRGQQETDVGLGPLLAEVRRTLRGAALDG